MRQTIDAAAFQQMVIHAAAAISVEKQQVNDLNVFPVPDGDTGTNMSLTIAAAAGEMKKKSYDTVGQAAQATASALLRGARGNSGVILSLLFRGFAKAIKDRETMDGRDLAIALDFGVAAAYKAVMKPTEGTILTVARVAYEEGRAAAEENKDPVFVWTAICQGATDALRTTPELLPVLTDDSWGEKLRLAFTNLDSSAFKRLLASIYVGDVGIQGVKSRLALQRFSNELFSVAGSFGEFDQAAEEKRNYTNWLCETIEKPKQLYEEAGRILEQQFSRYLESQMMWNDRHVRAALRYISAHFSEDIQLDDLAAAVGLNPAYLSGLLKNKTGMTYSEHLLKARMERAKELLAGSNAIVKSVCYEVGYRDVKYFSRLFRQYTGVNPSIYQKMHSIL